MRYSVIKRIHAPLILLKIENPMKNTLFKAIVVFALSTFLSTPKIQAQTPTNPSDSVVYYKVQTAAGYAEGRIIRESETEIEVLKKDGTLIIIPKNSILSKTVIPNPKNIGPIIQPTRYLYAPSAIPLKKGEGYLNLIYGLVVQAQYGITDNVSIGMTTTPAFMPTFVNLKAGTKINEKMHISAGGQMGKIWYGDEESLGLLFTNFTYGTREANITINAGYGFYTQSKDQLPIVEVSGLYQSSPKVSLVGELWVLMHHDRPATIIGGPALRINAFKKGFVDIGVLSAAFSELTYDGYYDNQTGQYINQDGFERNNFWPIPFLSLGFTF